VRIALIGPAWPLRGGIANFNEALAQALQSEGHDVHLFSFSLQYPSILFPGKTQLDTGPAPEGLQISSIINSINPFNWFSSAKTIRNWKPDLVIVRFWLPFMGPSLGTICRRLRKHAPVIAITDNVIPHERRPGDRWLTRYFVRSCDGFVAMSRSVLDDLGRFVSNRPKSYLPHPIYSIFGATESRREALDQLKLDPSYSYLLFFGIVRKYKGLDLLLEAMKQVDIRGLKLKLIVAGEFYEDKNTYMEQIRNNGLEENVIVHDKYISSTDVRHYFCASSLVTQTYRSATQSGVTQIAYHFGRPMLVTDVGGLAETVPHGKVGYVTNQDPKVIAGYIDDFFRNGREQDMARNVEEERSRFSWDHFTRGVFDLMQEVNR
jgi:D-inositol-3-phosphate glycosyltransferase